MQAEPAGIHQRGIGETDPIASIEVEEAGLRPRQAREQVAGFGDRLEEVAFERDDVDGLGNVRLRSDLFGREPRNAGDFIEDEFGGQAWILAAGRPGENCQMEAAAMQGNHIVVGMDQVAEARLMIADQSETVARLAARFGVAPLTLARALKRSGP